MAQVTKDMIDRWLKQLDAGRHIDSTSGEEMQLCYAWLQVRNLRTWFLQHSYSDAEINEIANRGIAGPRLQAVKVKPE